jgi:hypothetical protein
VDTVPLRQVLVAAVPGRELHGAVQLTLATTLLLAVQLHKAHWRARTARASAKP